MMNHRPRKRFGQHFLHDPNVIGRIIAAINPKPDDVLVEIGPGTGALTRPLLERNRRLMVVELDRDLAASMRDELGPSGLRVVETDALAHDFRQTSKEAGSAIRLVGNLPYNISTPLLFHLLDEIESIVDMHIMVQKEVADRLVATPNSKAYGRLGVMVAARAKAVKLFDVGPGAFSPPPKVESSVVRLSPLDEACVPHGELSHFAATVRDAFAMRRKTLRRIFAKRIDAQAIEACGISPSARAETLGVEEFLALSRAISATRNA